MMLCCVCAWEAFGLCDQYSYVKYVWIICCCERTVWNAWLEYLGLFDLVPELYVEHLMSSHGLFVHDLIALGMTFLTK